MRDFRFEIEGDNTLALLIKANDELDAAEKLHAFVTSTGSFHFVMREVRSPFVVIDGGGSSSQSGAWPAIDLNTTFEGR